jgi:hypothetical protein
MGPVFGPALFSVFGGGLSTESRPERFADGLGREGLNSSLVQPEGDRGATWSGSERSNGVELQLFAMLVTPSAYAPIDAPDPDQA